MLRLLLLLLLVFALAGGGVGTWYFGIRGEPIPGLSEDRTAAETDRADKPAFANAKDEYVPMDPLSFPVMKEGRVTKLMTMKFKIRVAGGTGMEAVADNRARLRDAFLTELHSLYALEFVRENDDQLGYIKERLVQAGREVIGRKLRGIEYEAIQGRDIDQES
jgi:flagellar basal body-associated protein FliL